MAKLEFDIISEINGYGLITSTNFALERLTDIMIILSNKLKFYGILLIAVKFVLATVAKPRCDGLCGDSQ